MVSEGARRVETFGVSVAGRLVGHLFQHGDHVWLEWQEGYWDDPNRPVLGLRFEMAPNEPVAAALRVPPWFSNLLPEGRLREWVARDAGVSPQREMMLLRRLGPDLPGAVSISSVGDVDPTWRPDRVVSPVAPKDTGEHRLRISLAGVALKFSMLQSGDRLTVPGRDQIGDWIVKMPDATYEAVPQNEYATMTMAHSVGIDVPPIRLLHRDELQALPASAWAGQEWAYGISRFDRMAGVRVHMEDMCQVRGFYPDHKYAGSFETVAALTYRRRDRESYLEFVRRLFFSYAVGNGDMHLKNVTLIYPDGRRPVISPAYDLVCTAPYLDHDEDLGLKLGRSRSFASVTPDSFLMLARRVGAPEDGTRDVVREVASRLPSAWAEVEDSLAILPIHRRWLAERIPVIARAFA